MAVARRHCPCPRRHGLGLTACSHVAVSRTLPGEDTAEGSVGRRPRGRDVRLERSRAGWSWSYCSWARSKC